MLAKITKRFFLSKPSYKLDVLSTLVTNVMIVGLGLGSGILAARLLGPDQRGILAVIVLWPTIFVTVGALGLTQAIVYYAGQHHEDISGVFTTAMVIAAIQSGLVYVIGYLALPLILQSYDQDVIQLSRFYLLYAFLAFLGGYPLFILQGLSRLWLWNVLRLLFPMAYCLLLVLLGLFNTVCVDLIVQGMILIHGVGSVLNILVLLIVVKPGWKFQTDLVSPLLGYGLKNMLAVLPVLLNQRLDQMVISIFLNPTQIGLYVVAVAFMTGLAPIAGAFAAVTFSRVARSQNPAASRSIIAQSFRLNLLLQGTAAAMLIVMMPLLVVLLFGAEFAGAITAARILVIGALASGFNQVLSDGLRGLNYPLGPAYGQIIGISSLIPLFYLLLPGFDIIGAAMASSASYWITTVFLLWFVQRHAQIPPRELFSITRSDLRKVIDALRSMAKLRANLAEARMMRYEP